MDWFQLCTLCAYLWTQTFATPPSGYVKPPDTDQNPPKYEFGYDVKDGQGGSQGHLETREGEYALGKYYVNLPSNEQKVDYFADDWGYHPLVEYRTSSASSSMSTQFALGEKAVAALSRQHGVAPPLEIFKTKSAKSLIAGAGPHVSIQGSSGIIPGPSDEPVHNSLEGDTYSSTTTTQAPFTYEASLSPSTLRYDNSPVVNYQHASTGVEFSTSAPITRTEQSSAISYPVSSEGHSASYFGAVESHSQQYHQGGSSASAGYSTTENYNSHAGVNSEESPRNEYESKHQNYYGQQASSGSQEFSPASSPVSQDYVSSSSKDNYKSSVRPSYSTSTQNYEQSSSYLEGQNGHQITSYLADSNAAVDVTRKGSSHGLPGVSDYSPNTRISAVLVAEEGNKYEENEIRNDYGSRFISSTTQNPPKTLLKPIVVKDTGGVSSPLALYSAYGATSNEGYVASKIGKLYHREGSLKHHGSYSSTTDSVDRGQEFYSTPAPTAEPVLVTPRLEASRLTSSGNFLAPIQAALSISANHNMEDCDEKQATYEFKENIPSSGPDIEKQELKVEAVYKTTVDIQKSIPFEIHPNEPYYQSSAEHQSSGAEKGSQQTSEVETEYHDQRSNGLQSQIENIQISQHSQEEYEQPKQDEFNDSKQSDYQSQISSGYAFSNTANEHSSEVIANNDNRNRFLQQVLFSYHKMANNQNKPYIAEDGSYQTESPVHNPPLFVPNRLYYVYMQRYNPYANRYGTLYTNYRPPLPQALAINDAGSYTNEESTSQVNQQGQFQSQRYPGELTGNINSVAYSVLGASQGGHHGHETSGTTSNVVYSNQVQGSQLPSTPGESAFENVNVNYVQNVADINVSPNYSNEARQYDFSQNTAQQYATQLNALSASSGSGGVPNSEEQHAQYATGQEGDKQEEISGNYHQQESSSFQQIETVEGQSIQGRYTGDSSNQNTKSLINEVPVPHYGETTKLVEVGTAIPVPQQVPVEYTNIVENPVHHTQYVEKQVPVPQPIPIEVTRIVEKPVPIPHPFPVEYTKVVAVEKPVAVPHPVPYAVTKLVALDRPVAYPQPVPFPYPVPHPVGVPVPHLVHYPNVLPAPVKDYRPVYVYRKPSGARLLHRDGHYHHHQVKNSPAFRPSQPMFASQYPPQTYEVTAYFKGPHVKGRGHGRKLCIEYGGFKPPLVPSVQIEAEPKPTYGPPAEEKKD